ncbi:MAG: DegV family protein [Halanaerobiaceae bacterium]|nr:DegV family protein [Halanaerobiaceae bacterium]HLV09624.1 DegV family protein [Halanaerobiales bacterium]
MKIKILTDSACDLPQKLLKHIEVIPISLLIDGQTYKDTVDITKKKFYDLIQKAKNFTGTAAPSPYEYLKQYVNENDNVFVFTISSALSSSYNNALMAKNMLKEQFSEKANKVIHVFDSLNASIGQGLIILKLKELIEKKLPQEQVIEQLETYIKETKTFFILDKMDNLIKSGRINKVVGKLISTLNIKLIMGKSDEGEIVLYDKVRGAKNSLNRLLSLIENHGSKLEEKILGIAHYDCLEKAMHLKEKAQQLFPFKDVIITEMGPTIAAYADRGGLLISF